MRWRHALIAIVLLIGAGLALAGRGTTGEPEIEPSVEPTPMSSLAEFVQRVQAAQERALEATKQNLEANERLRSTAEGLVTEESAKPK